MIDKHEHDGSYIYEAVEVLAEEDGELSLLDSKRRMRTQPVSPFPGLRAAAAFMMGFHKSIHIT